MQRRKSPAANHISAKIPGNPDEANSSDKIKKIRPRSPGHDVISSVSRESYPPLPGYLAVMLVMQCKKRLRAGFWRAKQPLLPSGEGRTRGTPEDVDGDAQVLCDRCGESALLV
jgi:hypothetical protein